MTVTATTVIVLLDYTRIFHSLHRYLRFNYVHSTMPAKVTAMTVTVTTVFVPLVYTRDLPVPAQVS